MYVYSADPQLHFMGTWPQLWLHFFVIVPPPPLPLPPPKKKICIIPCKELLPGPDFANQLIGVMLRFRKEIIAFITDIEKTCFQMHVAVW